MNTSQSNPRRHKMHLGKCGGPRSAMRAAKRAKFESWMQAKTARHARYMNQSSSPAVNVKESDDQFELQIFAPGYSKGAFTLALTDSTLTITGKGIQEPSDDGSKWRRKEYTANDFERKFEMNDKIDSDKISAEYKEGVLIVTLPKKEGQETVRQTIDVE